MSKEKKTALRFNWVDAVIVLFVVAAVAAALLLRRAATGENAKTVPMHYTVELKNLPTDFPNQLTVGGDIYNSKTGAYLGKIAEWETMPYYEYEYEASLGRYVRYENARYITALVTVENDGYETESAVIIGGETIRTGMEIAVKGRGFGAEGYVVALDAGELTQSKPIEPSERTVIYMLSCDEVRRPTVEAFCVGDRLYGKENNALLGEIIDVQAEPYTEAMPGPDGQTVLAEKPDYYRVVVTVRAEPEEKNGGLYLGGTAELKVGAEIKVVGKRVDTICRFYSLGAEE